MIVSLIQISKAVSRETGLNSLVFVNMVVSRETASFSNAEFPEYLV